MARKKGAAKDGDVTAEDGGPKRNGAKKKAQPEDGGKAEDGKSDAAAEGRPGTPQEDEVYSTV